MKATEMRMLQAMKLPEQEYVVNGVRYIVASRFQKFKPKENKPIFLRDRLEHYLTTNTADLTAASVPSMMDSECVCSAVGKEAYEAEQKEC